MYRLCFGLHSTNQNDISIAPKLPHVCLSLTIDREAEFISISVRQLHLSDENCK